MCFCCCLYTVFSNTRVYTNGMTGANVYGVFYFVVLVGQCCCHLCRLPPPSRQIYHLLASIMHQISMNELNFSVFVLNVVQFRIENIVCWVLCKKHVLFLVNGPGILHCCQNIDGLAVDGLLPPYRVLPIVEYWIGICLGRGFASMFRLSMVENTRRHWTVFKRHNLDLLLDHRHSHSIPWPLNSSIAIHS